MKKFCAFFIALLLSFSAVFPAYAAEFAPAMPSPSIGYIEDEFGNCYSVVGELMDYPTVCNGDGSCSVTYRYDIDRAIVNHQHTSDAIDSGYASHVYLTINYRANGNQVLLTSVSGYWTILDYNASVSSARLTYSCDYSTGPQNVYGQSVNNNFSINTGFTTYYDMRNIYVSIGAFLKLTYIIGNSRTWTFTLYNNVN